MKSLRTDTGAAMVTIAISMLLLMGMAAIAIDSGILYNDRRQQQSAADGGALAAVQFAKTTLPTAMCTAYSGFNRATCRGAEEAIDVANGTLNNRYTNAAWAACTDPNRPVEFTRISPITPCVSFTQNFQKARVRMPGTDVETTFGKVIGFNSARVGAFAHANADLNQSGGVLPFAVGPTGAASSQTCLVANPATTLDVAPCNGPVEGNFGKLNVYIYNNATLGTPSDCGTLSNTLRMATNIIVGSDHPLELASKTTPGTVDDIANCPIITNPVDHLHTLTGNSANGITDGLLMSISTPSLEGRLRCKDGDASEYAPAGYNSIACIAVNNTFPETLDNGPLWSYINYSDAGEAIPSSACTAAIKNRQEMAVCLIAWKAYGSSIGHPATSNLFTNALAQSPRFAAVPILASDPGIGSGDYDIIDFRPIFLETLYLKCTANSCDTVFSPGETGPATCPSPLLATTNTCGVPGNGMKSAYALTSFVMTLDMLPETVRENFPSRQGTVVFNLSN